MDSPLVSVVIPTYNSGHLLPKAIESVWAQTYTHFEIIVVDDGSTDDTPAWAAANAGLFHYFRQTNKGQAIARNRGADLAKGELVAFLDADDMWLPTKLDKQISAVRKDPNASFVFSDGYRVDSNINYRQFLATASEWPRLSSLYACSRDVLTFGLEFKMHSVATSSLMIKRDTFYEIGGTPEMPLGEDFVLCCLLLSKGPAFNIPEPLMIYRVHGGNTSSAITNRRQALERILAKDNARLAVLSHARRLGPPPKIALVYSKLPLPSRLLLLLIWRFYYGASRKKILLDLRNYLGFSVG